MPELLEEENERPDHNHAALAPDSHAQIGRIVSGLTLFAMLSVVLVVVVANILRFTERTRALLPSIHTPVTVIDEVDHLAAPSYKAIPLSLPHEGIVSIRVRVLRGDLVDVFLITPDRVEGIMKGEWTNVKSFGGVAAVNTDSYQHTGQLAKGGYYLVVMDRLISVPSATRSDVSVVVQFNQE